MGTEKDAVGALGVNLSNDIAGRIYCAVPDGNLTGLFLNDSAQTLKLFHEVLLAKSGLLRTGYARAKVALLLNELQASVRIEGRAGCQCNGIRPSGFTFCFSATS
jgi:hypothetical protein